MRSITVAKRVMKQIIGDKRTIGMMLLAPIFVIYLFSIILTSAPEKAKVDVISAPEEFIVFLEDEAEVTNVSNENEAIDNLKEKKSDGFIDFSGDKAEITIDGSDPNTAKLTINSASKAVSSYSEDKLSVFIKDISKILKGNTVKVDMPNKPEINYLYGSEDMDLFDVLAPTMMGFFIFFFVFLIAGVSFLRERISGTLDRILATPLKRSEIVLGYFIGFGTFVVIQTVIIQLFMFYGLDINLKGNFLSVLLINIILAAGSLSLGTFLSSFARNELQLFQFIPVIIIPQILFSGIFNLTEAPTWVHVLSKVFPLTYGAEALKNVAIKGYTLGEVSFDVFMLTGYAILFIMLNILALKKYRRI
ncbi:ABC transporter permease [Clostridium sp. YIM B02506]|uniref:ABC transporter permease n=1 Tax=Clostridium sp. YIM B02506 TaxID=2910680 RepID=UPI001EEDC3D2|nr:ABC transporter permease [Clostridium sp. YIM B02506]